MATGYIGNALLKRLVPADRDQFVWDTEIPGFGVKVTPAGKMAYVFTYRAGRGRSAPKLRMTIGPHGAWTPQQAREQAAKLRRSVDDGRDPRQEVRTREQQRRDLEIASYVQQFSEQYLRTRWKGGFDVADGILRRSVVPAWRGRHLAEITRRDVANLVTQLSGQPALCRNAFAVLRKLFRWAVNNGDIEASPLTDMEAPPGPPSRDRVLSDGEVHQMWSATEKLGHPFAPFLKLLVVTGQRRDEVAGMKWDELDRNARVWIVPSERVKNGRATIVHLSDLAVAIIDSVAQLGEGSGHQHEGKWPKRGLLFSTTGTTPISGYSKAKARLDRFMLEAAHEAAQEAGEDPEGIEIEAWRLHDLRRTVATGLQRLGIAREVTEAVLNHQSGSLSGLGRVYQLHDYKEEKQSALDLWGRHLQGLIA